MIYCITLFARNCQFKILFLFWKSGENRMEYGLWQRQDDIELQLESNDQYDYVVQIFPMKCILLVNIFTLSSYSQNTITESKGKGWTRARQRQDLISSTRIIYYRTTMAIILLTLMHGTFLQTTNLWHYHVSENRESWSMWPPRRAGVILHSTHAQHMLHGSFPTTI